MPVSSPRAPAEPIAITGIGCRLPGAANDFSSACSLFRSGRDTITAVPGDRWDASAAAKTRSGRVVPAVGAFLDGIDRFDADLFGIAPREARAMDPQQRILLEIAWAALEDAGLPPDQLQGRSAGVFVGMGLVDWARRTFASGDPDRLDAWAGTGSFDSVLAGRISFALGLTGPAMAVHTACSSSLVAMHLAARSLREGECDLALAGGVNLLLSPEPTIYFAELQALSPTGRCRTFDAAADGYVRGEGAGLFVLRRLSDALSDGDYVYGVILGSAVNQDGRTMALTAPSGRAQAALVRSALQDAGLAPGDVGYVEAHGTGTPLGDPIEIAALAEVFGGSPSDKPLYVGSAKTQVGHLEAAAGVAGVIRALGALREGFIPPHLHLEALNPRISLGKTRLQIPSGGQVWEEERRIASVSGFGLSGTNAHLVLGMPPRRSEPEARSLPCLVAVSGHDPKATRARWAQVLSADPTDPVALARAASAGRAQHKHRIALLWRQGEALPEEPPIIEAGRPQGIVFAFTGQGSQHTNMGRQLYEREPVYRAAMDEVARLYRDRTGRDLLAVISGAGEGSVDETRYTQPALLALQWSLVQLLASFGVRPDAVLGHSIGEVVAAIVAGVVSLEQGVAMVAARADLLADLPPGGAMAAVHAPLQLVQSVIERLGGLDIAAINAPDEVTIAGPGEAVDRALADLQAAGVRATRLSVSHAFHSSLVEPACAAFEAAVRTLDLSAPKIPLYSALTGALVEGEAAEPSTWSRHLREPVRFASALQAAADDGHTLFVEIGPRPILSALGARVAPESRWLLGLHPDRDDRERLYEALAGLFVSGARLDLRSGLGWWSERRTVTLPPYPFGGQSHWIAPVSASRGELPARYTLIEETSPYLPGKLGRLRVADERLAREIRAAGGEVSNEAEDVVLSIETPSDLQGAVSLVRDPRVRRITLVARGEGLAADAARGFLATGIQEHPDRFSAVIVGEDKEIVRALAGLGREEEIRALPSGMAVPRLVQTHAPRREPPRLDPIRPILVTGGTGALGLEIARWLVDLGAKRIILASRRGSADPAALAGLRARGAELRIEAIDVADEGAVQALLSGLDLQGVIHAAGLAAPKPLVEIDQADLAEVFRPKIEGAVLLDRLTRGMRLDFFLLVSSIAALWGSPGLSAYGAANRALFGIAARRREASLPASVAALGPIDIEGMVSREERARFAASGVRPIRIDALLMCLGDLISRDAPWAQVIADVDWELAAPLLRARRSRPVLDRLASAAPEQAPRSGSALASRLARAADAEREGILREEIRGAVARVLGLRAAGEVHAGAGLFDIGLDSAMAVELASALRALTALPLPPTIAFDYPSVDALTKHLLATLAPGEARERSLPAGPRATGDGIAVIGVGCRLPGARTPEEFWALLEGGLDAVGEAPPDRLVDLSEPAHRRGGWLQDVGAYEPSFFGIGPSEAAAIDPQQRLAMEVLWETLERAGLAPDRLADSATGIFVGAPRSEYWDLLREPATDEIADSYPWSGTGNESSFVAGRLAHTLGTRGPAITLNTACSSSLVAVHLACSALREGECDLALSGGVNLLLSSDASRYLSTIGALSPTGRCHTFDASADGYVRGEGCGFVLLKRLPDAIRDGDRVLAVIRGSAVGHDGRSSGLGVPSGPAQQQVIARALEAASVRPAEVAVLEAHGTGTPLGDPIEIGAGCAVYGEGRERPLIVTASKSQIGHLETAAGIAGLIKLVLALQHGIVPGTPSLRRRNEALPDGPYEIPTRAVPWPDGRKLAAISSFGISGTLAHVVIEGFEAPEPSDEQPPGPHLLLLSAHTEPALRDLGQQIRAALAKTPAIDVASTLLYGRAQRRFRLAAVGSGESLTRQLETAPVAKSLDAPRVGMLFTGQGAQRARMLGPALLADKDLRELSEELFSLAPDPEGLRRLLCGEDPAIDETRFAQPALVLLEILLARWLERRGIVPVVVLGHSVGEIAAAAVAGILTPKDALYLATIRGAAMADQPGDGAMAAIRGDEAEVMTLISAGIEIAALNGPRETVVSGPRPLIEALCGKLGERARLLRTSHAFHSAMMEGARASVGAAAARIAHTRPRSAFLSGLTGAELERLDGGYWSEALRAKVRFSEALAAAVARCDLLVEVGPRPVLSAIAAHLTDKPVIPTLGSGDDEGALLRTLGALWSLGVPLEARAIAERRAPVLLPTTPWRRIRPLLGAPKPARPLPAPDRLAISWEKVRPGVRPLSVSLAGDGALVERLSAHLPDGGPAARAVYCARGGEGTEPLRDTLAFLQAACGGRRSVSVLTARALSIASEAPDPAQAAIWGLVTSVALEHPELSLQIIDLPSRNPEEADIVALLAALSRGEPRMAIRGGEPSAPRMRAATAPSEARSVRRAAQGRVAIVTGGTGGIGPSVIEALLEAGASAVIVASRRGADPEIGARGDRVEIVSADLSQPQAAEALVARARARGDLGIVLHLAGQTSESLARDLDPDALSRVFAAKVRGAIALDAALPPEVPLVAFSSAIGWLGREGASAYGAANAALDAVIAARRARGGQGITLQWGPWAMGMAGARDWSSEGARPMSASEGTRALLGSDLGGDVATMPIFLDGAALVRRYGQQRPSWLEGAPGIPQEQQEEPEKVAELRARSPRERRALVLSEVSAVIEGLLDRGEPIATSRGLFDAGLDSIGAVELARRLSARFALPLPSTTAFDHPDAERLADRILALLFPEERPEQAARAQAAAAEQDIAILGMACRFPGASTPEAFWELLLAGRIPIGPAPPERWRVEDWYDPVPGKPGKMYVREGGFLEGIDGFDPEFFGISPREAASLDPQQRILLEVSHEALERAGLSGVSLKGSKTGIFVGIAERHYLMRAAAPGKPLYPDAWAGTGTEPSFAPGRVAHALGLRGPAAALNTTCSSSLVAVHLACNALRRGECEAALAGGVSLMLLPDDTAYLCAIGALSPTHRCHTFEESADGYARSEGAGIFVLKRLSDAVRDGDPILAVIRGSAMGHDGASSGLTVPNGAAQEDVLREALARSGAAPSEVGLLEAHGTGTRLGDPIEVRAAMAVYGDRGASGPLLLGAVKANLGHLELAAGAASLMKVVLALQHQTVPPQPAFSRESPEIDFRGAVVPRAPTPWPRAARLAAVSGFGLSGTNAHLVVAPAPEQRSPPRPEAEIPERPVHLLAISAASEQALSALAAGLIGCGPLPDRAATVHKRRPLTVRAAVVAASDREADEKLLKLVPVRARPVKVGFLFSGQGSQHEGMGLTLAQGCPAFRRSLAASARALEPSLGASLEEILSDRARLSLTENTQPVLLAYEIALARTLMSFGIVPAAVAGHSLGEIAAATIAGVWSEGDALSLAFERGRAMAERAKPGIMAAIAAPSSEVSPLLEPGAEIAAYNAPDETVIAGEVAPVEATLARLPAGTSVRRLEVSRPFHSACVEPMLDTYERTVASLSARLPEIPVVSMLTGRIEREQLTQPSFWRRHAREPVRFVQGVEALAAMGCNAIVEIGPHPVLLGLARRSLPRPPLLVPAQRRDADSWRTLTEAVGALFEAGLDVDLTAWDAPYPRRFLSLPTTPFDRKRYWIEEPERLASPRGAVPAWRLAWRQDTSSAPAPDSIAIAGELPGLGEALSARGISVLPSGQWLLSARALAHKGLEESLLAEMDGDERPRIVLVAHADADPVQRAVAALVRAWAFERPGAPIRILDVRDMGPEQIAAALGSGEPELRLNRGREVPRLEEIALTAEPPRLSGRFLVTGGGGSIGAEIARWLRRCGADGIVLASRSPLSASDPRETLAAELRATGAEVYIEQLDVSDEAAVRDLLARHPVEGVVHCAGITEPAPVRSLDRARMQRILSGKALGAQSLDRALGDRQLQLFVMISSIASVWGSRDLAPYAAANAVLDAIAEARRARGLAGTSIALGPVLGSTMVDPGREAELARAGLSPISMREVLSGLEGALMRGEAHVILARADLDRLVPALEVSGPKPLFDAIWRRPAPERGAREEAAAPSSPFAALQGPALEAALQELIERRVRQVMRLDAARPLPVDQAISDLGFDSLMATELKAVLLEDGIDIPLGRLLGGPSLEELVIMAVARMPERAAPERPAEVVRANVSQSEPDRTLFWTHLAALIAGVGLASAVWALW